MEEQGDASKNLCPSAHVHRKRNGEKRPSDLPMGPDCHGMSKKKRQTEESGKRDVGIEREAYGHATYSTPSYRKDR